MHKKPKWHVDKRLIKVTVEIEGCDGNTPTTEPRIVWRIGPVSDKNVATETATKEKR